MKDRRRASRRRSPPPFFGQSEEAGEKVSRNILAISCRHDTMNLKNSRESFRGFMKRLILRNDMEGPGNVYSGNLSDKGFLFRQNLGL